MKRFFSEFARRGLCACGLGPIVLVILYHILHRTGNIQSLSVDQVCIGILSITALAFIAGGMNAIYQIERLPLMVAIFLHGTVLYLSYLGTYLINDWLEWGMVSVLVFTAIFIVGYFAIWAIIYSIIKKKTNTINEKLRRQQSSVNESEQA